MRPTAETLSPRDFENEFGVYDEDTVPVCEGEWRREPDGWWRYWAYDEEDE